MDSACNYSMQKGCQKVSAPTVAWSVNWPIHELPMKRTVFQLTNCEAWPEIVSNEQVAWNSHFRTFHRPRRLTSCLRHWHANNAQHEIGRLWNGRNTWCPSLWWLWCRWRCHFVAQFGLGVFKSWDDGDGDVDDVKITDLFLVKHWQAPIHWCQWIWVLPLANSILLGVAIWRIWKWCEICVFLTSRFDSSSPPDPDWVIFQAHPPASLQVNMKFIFWVIQLPISYSQNCNLAKSGMHSISQIIQVYPRYVPNISITSSTGHIRFKPLGSKFTWNIARKFIDCYISFFAKYIYTNCQLCPTRTLGFFHHFLPGSNVSHL